MRTKIWIALCSIVIASMLVLAVGFAAPSIVAEARGGPDWDKSSLSVSGDCVDNLATFTVTNDGSGDMAGGTTYSYSIEGDGTGTGSIPALASGESYTFSISAPAGAKVSVIVYQRPGHPGTGQAKADATCEGTPPVSHTVTYGQVTTCDGWAAWYSIDDGPEVTYAAGGWTNGAATVPAFDIPTNPGELYNLTHIPAIDLTQPEGCTPPPPTQHTVTYGQETNCDGWTAWYAIDGGSHVQYASGGWTNGSATVPSFDIPTIPGDEYNLTEIPEIPLSEPEGCIPPPPTQHTVTYGQDTNCDGWTAWYAIDGGSHVQYASGGWTNGAATVPSFDIPTIPGDEYNLKTIPSVDLTEPEGCIPPPPTQHTVSYGQETNCDGWTAWYAIDGGSHVQYASGGWTNGSATVPAFDIPTIPGDEYNLTHIPAIDLTQPEGCNPPPPTQHTVTYGQDPTCDSWTAWYAIDGGSHVQYASGGWTNGSATVPAFDIPTIPGDEYNLTHIPEIPLSQPEGCNPPPPPSDHTHKLGVVANCTGYTVTPQSPDGGVFVPSGTSAPLTGLWTDPNKDETVTITGTWTWPDGFTAQESVTIRESAACAGVVKKNWKPVCPKCDLKNSKHIVSWPTDQGDASWKSRKLEGSLPAGVSVSVVIDDCTTKQGGRCTLTQWVIVQYNATALAGKKIEFIDHGKNWLTDVKPHLGIDGNQWVKFEGRVCNWLDTRDAKNDKQRNAAEQKCNSSNDWQVYIDGVLQRPYVYPGPNNLLYPYWLCSLPPSFAMTQQASDGSWEIEWLPGMNTWGATIWYLKWTNVWPLGWPEDTSQHSWIWHLPPLSDARKWADNYRLAGLFKYYKMPTK